MGENKRVNLRLVICLILLGFCCRSFAQEQDSIPFSEIREVINYDHPSPDWTEDYALAAEEDSIEIKNNIFRRIGRYFSESNQDKSFDKRMDFSILGGPHYSDDVKFGIGLVAAGLYRIDRTEDRDLKPSNVSFFGDIATSGFYVIGVTGNTFFPGGKFRLDYNVAFLSMPSRFWGIGHDAGLHNHAEKYKRQQIRVNTDFMYRTAPNFFTGVNASFNYIWGKDFTDDGLLYLTDSHGKIQRLKNTNTGIGAFVIYDSRDVVTDPRRGWYIKGSFNYFPGFLGNKSEFGRTELTVDFYHRVWEGGTLAYDFHSLLNTGDVPWTMLSMMGGTKRMRGYYEGRFRDKGLAEVQVELRQRVWRRIGFTVWGGAGNVFPKVKDFDLSKTLPNYGVGFRWEFKKGINVRLDYGIGKKESGFIFNINEAF